MLGVSGGCEWCTWYRQVVMGVVVPHDQERPTQPPAGKRGAAI